MGEAKGTIRKGARRGPRLFIRAGELAWHLDCDPETLHRWVADGTIPPPHSWPGSRSAVWLRRHFDAYVLTGEWPEESFKARGG